MAFVQAIEFRAVGFEVGRRVDENCGGPSGASPRCAASGWAEQDQEPSEGQPVLCDATSSMTGP